MPYDCILFFMCVCVYVIFNYEILIVCYNYYN